MRRVFIDVREPEEFASGHVPGALNIPPARIIHDLSDLKDVPKDTELVLYCRSGSRSNVAMNILLAHGYTNVINGINKERIFQRYF